MDKKCSSLYQRILNFAREKKVDPDKVTPETGTLPWSVEVALVASGLKRLAMTHFDTPDETTWDDDMYLDAAICGVQSIVLPTVPMDYQYPLLLCDRYFDGVSRESKSLGEDRQLCSPINQMEIIWFLEENRPFAILLAKHTMAKVRGKTFFPPELEHEINGLLFGYSDQSILQFTGEKDKEKLRQALKWIQSQLRTKPDL